jgi:hypothetical protein
MSRKAKYLIDTSAIRAALADSTTSHNQHFQSVVGNTDLYVSVYIRMEFIRRWFCDYVRLALAIDQFRSVSDALVFLEQDFKINNIKGVLAAISKILSQNGLMENNRAAAEEIASLAIASLRMFDKVFPSRIANLCRCQIGGLTPSVDYNDLLKDVRDFYEKFRIPVTDCEVNDFLKLRHPPKSRAKPILVDQGCKKLKVVQNLKEFSDRATHVTCTECSRIGDSIIALEQPMSWCLVHLDNSFNDLCRVLGRTHKQIKSVVAIQKAALGSPPPTV